MIERPDREDTRRQEERVQEARDDLAHALAALAAEARVGAKAAASRRGTPDLLAIAGLHRAVEAAGEQLDIAVLDLQGARGAHL